MGPLLGRAHLEGELDHDDTHFTVLVRLPFNRGDFVDPPPV